MDTPPVEPGDPELTAFWLRFFRRIVAALQVGGGLYGLYNVAVSVQYSVSRVVLLLAFVLFAASVSGGILLALDRPCGVTISLFVQALQVFQIAANGLVYSFVCDMELMFSINPSGEEGWAAHLVWYYPSPLLFFHGVSLGRAADCLVHGSQFSGCARDSLPAVRSDGLRQAGKRAGGGVLEGS